MAWALLEIVVPLILAVLLGILIGWFLWRWRRTKVTQTEWASMQMRANSGERAAAEIQGLTTDIEGRDADLAACRSRVAELEAELEAAKAGGGSGDGAAALAAGEAADSAGDDAADTAADGGHEIQGLTGAAAATDAAEEAAAGDASSDDAASGDGAADDAAADDAASGDGADDAAGDENAVVGGERHPYGEGSHAPFEADAKVMPDGYEIKGNADSMLYHRPDSRVYGATIAEVWFDTAERAEAAGFTLAGSHPKDASDDADGAAEERAVVGGERHPYGEGSHAPFDGAEADMPDGYEIKGNADSMLYHRPDSRSYKATIPEVWFDTPERAEAAGFGLANSHPKD